jgi:hypothetical protein
MAANMAAALKYEDLRMSQVDARLDEQRELLILLPPRHARVLVSLIESTRDVQRGASFLARLSPMCRSLYSIGRALVFHYRLLDLVRVLVYCSKSATWNATPDGDVLFRFTR